MTCPEVWKIPIPTAPLNAIPILRKLHALITVRKFTSDMVSLQLAVEMIVSEHFMTESLEWVLMKSRLMLTRLTWFQAQLLYFHTTGHKVWCHVLGTTVLWLQLAFLVPYGFSEAVVSVG